MKTFPLDAQGVKSHMYRARVAELEARTEGEYLGALIKDMRPQATIDALRRISGWKMPGAALLRAELKAHRASQLARNAEKRRAEKALAEYEQVQLEAERLTKIMRGAPGASAAHRGTKSTHALEDRAKREVDAPRERVTDGKKHPVTSRLRP